MMCSNETCVQTLARRTIQQLMQNNSQEPLLLNWVVDHCFDYDQTTSQLYFHALSTAFTSMTVNSFRVEVEGYKVASAHTLDNGPAMLKIYNMICTIYYMYK